MLIVIPMYRRVLHNPSDDSQQYDVNFFSFSVCAIPTAPLLPSLKELERLRVQSDKEYVVVDSYMHDATLSRQDHMSFKGFVLV